MRKVLLIIAVVSLAVVTLLPLTTGVVAQDPEPVEVLEKRNLMSKTYDNQNGTFTLHAAGAPIHYEDEYGNLQNIDNAILPSTAPWYYEMLQDVYTARFLSDFTAGQVVEWECKGQTLAFQPMSLEWTNDFNQIDLISMPQDTAVLVTNEAQLVVGVDAGYRLGTIRWDDAYGVGRDFYWVCDPSKLSKVLELDTPLPTPPQYILDGGNPVVRLNFLFDPSSDLDIYVNGSLWDQTGKEQTLTHVAFVHSSTNETMWYFRPYQVRDSAGNETGVLAELRKSGGSLYVSARVPYEWLQAATYPVYIDPEASPYGDEDDAYLRVQGSNYNFVHDAAVGAVTTSSITMALGQQYVDFVTTYYIWRDHFFFDTSEVGSDSTVTAATLWLYIHGQVDQTTFNVQLQDGDGGRPSQPPVSSDYYYDYWSGDGGSRSSGTLVNNTYEDFDYDEEDLDWINKTGFTESSLRSSRDISETTPSNNEFITFRTANYTGEGSDPYIVVTYTTAGGNPYSWGTIIG